MSGCTGQPASEGHCPEGRPGPTFATSWPSIEPRALGSVVLHLAPLVSCWSPSSPAQSCSLQGRAQIQTPREELVTSSPFPLPQAHVRALPLRTEVSQSCFCLCQGSLPQKPSTSQRAQGLRKRACSPTSEKGLNSARPPCGALVSWVTEGSWEGNKT